MEKKRFLVHAPPKPGGPLGHVLLILWHGAGGDVDERTLVATARAFAAAGAVAVRARFAYRRQGRKMPDRMPRLVEDARATIEAVRAATRTKKRRLVIGGRSMGGRVASMLAAEGEAVDALVFLAYPLHPEGQPDKLRSAHLPSIACPMLFVAGDRDALSDLALLRPILRSLDGRAELVLYEGADHSLSRTDPEDIARRAVEWTSAQVSAEIPSNARSSDARKSD